MQSLVSFIHRIAQGKLKLAALALITLLSACRMPIVIQGEGFVFGAEAGEIYSDGFVFDINADFQQTFWPVPAPGHYFDRWNKICKGGKVLECSLNLPEEAWSEDREIPLSATFLPGYTGPMVLRDYQYYWQAFNRTLIIPADSIVLEGNDPGAEARAFVATPGMSHVVAGRMVGQNYEFTLPVTDYAPDDFWLFLSTLDEAGTLATVSYDFGIAESLNPIAELRPQNFASPWKDVLVGCAAASNPHAVCSMEKLPYLGAVTQNPTIDDIMKRVVVSHGWMGARFKAVLQNMPPEILQMFRGVTAVVIASDIRPAFFTALTGAIYIDPQDLWLTQAERDSIDWTPDFREGFGSDLQFIPAGTYLFGPYAAWGSATQYPEGTTRSLFDIIWPLGYVIVHELAHANDFVHPAIMPDASSTLTPLDLYYRLRGQDASTSLSNTYPLSSDLLYDVGGVLFWGDEATPQIANLSARTIGDEFAADSANGLYAYSTIYEDTATLVEEVLMYYFFGLDKLQSFLDVPTQEPEDCTDYILQWGSLNRASVPRIKERARLVLSTILDEADVSRYLNAVPEQRLLTPGVSLCENLDLLYANSPQPLPSAQMQKFRSMGPAHTLDPQNMQLLNHTHSLVERRTRKIEEHRVGRQ